MDLALAFTALLMGLAGAPHCAAMCGPACTALLGRSGRPVALGGGVQALQAVGAGAWWFHGMRVAGYALAGGLGGGGIGLLGVGGPGAHAVGAGRAPFSFARRGCGLRLGW